MTSQKHDKQVDKIHRASSKCAKRRSCGLDLDKQEAVHEKKRQQEITGN